MEQTKVKALVVGGLDYKEKDRLVTLFTLEHGLITVLFKGVKSKNAKLSSAKELFVLGDFIYTNNNLKIVTSAEIITQFYNITKNIKAYYCACNMLEIIKTVLPVGEVSADLFVDSLKCLSELENGTSNPYLILSKYIIRVFEGFGYKYDLDVCSSCGIKLFNQKYMNLRYGDITCINCRVGEVELISSAVFMTLKMLSQTNYDKIHTLKIPNGIIMDSFNLLNKNFYHRFGKNLEIL